MNQEHNHSCVCEHDRVRYCKHCQVVYCIDCHQEWRQYPTWSYTHAWPYTQPYQPSYPNFYGSAGGSDPNTVLPTTTCYHQE